MPPVLTHTLEVYIKIPLTQKTIHLNWDVWAYIKMENIGCPVPMKKNYIRNFERIKNEKTIFKSQMA